MSLASLAAAGDTRDVATCMLHVVDSARAAGEATLFNIVQLLGDSVNRHVLSFGLFMRRTTSQFLFCGLCAGSELW